MSARSAARRTRVAHIMGTAVSVTVVGDIDDDVLDGAAEACFGDLRRADRTFSTYRSDSDISRIARGVLTVEAADPDVREVAEACAAAEAVTGGLFSAAWSGAFDPTGYVKGWAVERAARRHIAPLLDRRGVVAGGVNAGGDMQLFTADGSGWTWNVGIADPVDTARVLATVSVRDGAVATSGTAERGAHVIDPRSGAPAAGTASVTVIAAGLAEADLWATAGLVAGFEDLSWTARAPAHTGLSVSDDGRVRRWVDAVEITAAEARLGAGEAPTAIVGVRS